MPPPLFLLDGEYAPYFERYISLVRGDEILAAFDQQFVGVLQEGYKAKLKDGTPVELKVSTIRLGTRLEVYYMPKEQKNNGRKEKYYEIFQVHFLPPAGN